LTGQRHAGTSIVREYPQPEGDPYYPIPRPENEFLLKRYQALAAKQRHVTFVGRLGQYRYYNMDQCVGAALKAAEEILKTLAPEVPLESAAEPALPAAQQAGAGS
jgi:UDP-galactopyranose mutase